VRSVRPWGRGSRLRRCAALEQLNPFASGQRQPSFQCLNWVTGSIANGAAGRSQLRAAVSGRFGAAVDSDHGQAVVLYVDALGMLTARTAYLNDLPVWTTAAARSRARDNVSDEQVPILRMQ
jgi:hypothetical protein